MVSELVKEARFARNVTKMRLLKWLSNSVILMKAFWHDSPFFKVK